MASCVRPRALIVEDDAAVGASIGMLLHAMGVDYRLAVDGKGAMEEFDRAIFDVAMIDLGLPDTDGRMLSLLIRQIDPRLPIVIMSADGVPLAGPRAPAHHRLEKPARPGQLRAMLDEIFGAASLTRQ